MWTVGKAKNILENIRGHFIKHGSEFGVHNSMQYYKLARKFFDAPPSGTLVKIQKKWRYTFVG